ncbi:phage antirepressor KilAC domain-containing protein [Enterococcus faecium]|nr:phage antirepressor KilAC domain-containing protein [Enterococcus faecium]
MNELAIFNYENNEVRTVLIDNEIWFVGNDVAKILGFKNITAAISQHVDREDKKSLRRKDCRDSRQSLWITETDYTNKTIINESGVYSLIFGSELPSAKKFKRWVTSEVLPSIRKNGMYAKDELLDNPDLLLEVVTQLKRERDEKERLKLENERMKPKALFASAVETARTTILVGELAKVLRQNGVDIGQNRLFEWLRANGYLCNKKGRLWNTPTQKSMELQLFEIKETVINKPDGTSDIKVTTKVTGKGQVYFINKFLSDE